MPKSGNNIKIKADFPPSAVPASCPALVVWCSGVAWKSVLGKWRICTRSTRSQVWPSLTSKSGPSALNTKIVIDDMSVLYHM